MKSSEQHITDNIKEQRFEMPVDDQLAFIVYRWEHGKLALMHTEVPQSAEGKGIASSLAKFVFEKAKQDQRKILVYCPFISTYLKRHPEYKALVEKDYNI